ncbi:fasciclin-like arabinogalactan protein 21 [Neltuma alba]|uniref:fasciclin-like arabinogalactan protein 21 n=1 Tax=Neltuma alba TaxID=207710 RepID=UPI0010A38011|nr:fasciclin-like arabinogalactan protein 21 [Prosopis alba]XP_028787913.1 fasciclin-like arabinogalactan protein 21 [Prosopis alba]
MAISMAGHFISSNSDQEAILFAHEVSVNASNALRRSGFNVMADLFQRSPPFFLPPQNSTLFAIRDSALRNTSLPPSLLRKILQFHTSTSMASMEDLLEKPQGSCIPTLFRHKNVAITKVDPRERLVEINHALISSPDMYLGNQIAIHGVLAPFSSVDFQDLSKGWEFVPSASCRSNSGQYSAFYESEDKVGWNRIVQLLSSNGYASFSIGLHSVLERIRTDSTSFESVTILAPPDLALLGSPSSLLDRAVRLHILPQRLTYRELASLPTRTLVKTLISDEYLEIEGVPDFISMLVINGVEIVAPDISISDKFVIHGISEALKMDALITT